MYLVSAARLPERLVLRAAVDPAQRIDPLLDVHAILVRRRPTAARIVPACLAACLNDSSILVFVRPGH